MGDLIFAILFHYPGAFIRWGLNGFKKDKFEFFTKKDPFINSVIAILFIAGIWILIKQLVKWL
jgi:hypothetical protein